MGQGHPRVMININFIKLYCLMLHAKFQNHRPSGSRLVTISQGTARNHFWEAGMLMQSSILDIVQ